MACRRCPRPLAPLKPLLHLLLCVALLAAPASAMKQRWSFEREDRAQFLIERFGFGAHGALDVRVADVRVFATGEAAPRSPPEETERDAQLQAGLLFVHEEDLWRTMAFADLPDIDRGAAAPGIDPVGGADDADDADGAERGASVGCVLQNRSQDVWVDLADRSTWNVSKAVVAHTDGAGFREGFYYLFFARCTPGVELSFQMSATLRNGPRDYLSAGDAPLPSVYLAASAAFVLAATQWLRLLARHPERTLRVHHVMSLLLAAKTACVFADAMRFLYMKQHGDTLTGWTPVFYALAFLKSALLFAALALLGAGWSLLKPHLSTRDKSVLSAVLVLQALSNTAMVLVDESAAGSRARGAWRDLLRVLDLLCCVCVVLPVMWSIRQLREAARTDGKAHASLRKLEQFRALYLLVVAYIYVTRIALLLLQAALPYNATWLAVLGGELASLGFFLAVGYRFRPVPHNPYLEVPTTHIDALDEFSLDVDDDDDDADGALWRAPVQRQDHGRVLSAGRPALAPPPARVSTTLPTSLSAIRASLRSLSAAARRSSNSSNSNSDSNIKGDASAADADSVL